MSTPSPSANPYAPPSARVADIADADAPFELASPNTIVVKA